MYLKIILAFLIPGLVGYGALELPLIEHIVVNDYGWMTVSEFSHILSFSNSLPGPNIAKVAAYIGYLQAGIIGVIIAVVVLFAPSLIITIALLNVLYKHKDSPRIQRLTLFVRPTVIVLMGLLACQFIDASYHQLGWVQTIILMLVSFVLLEKVKLHPCFVILGMFFVGVFYP